MAQGPRGGRINRRLLWALPILLFLAVVVNLDSIGKIARGEKSPKSIVMGMTAAHEGGFGGWKVPPNSGAKTAKVTVEVFVNESDSCHTQTFLLGQALSTVDPKRIRVVWVNTRSGPKAIARREQVKLGCEQGIAVDGQTKFKVPGPTSPTKQTKTVYLTQHNQGMSQTILRDILDQALKAKYKGKGMAMSGPEFEKAMAAATARLHDKATAEQGGTGKAGSKPGPDATKTPGPGTPQ